MALQDAGKEAGVLVQAEERAVGRVDRRLYRTYLAAWGPLFLIPIFMILFATSERGLQVNSAAVAIPAVFLSTAFGLYFSAIVMSCGLQ